MLDGKFVLINLSQAAAQYVFPDCKTKFTGSAAGGLLATIDQATAAAELRVFGLPEGKLLSAFPIPSCSRSGQACSFNTESGEWVAQWDPSGRYLIFSVILDGANSDQYLYDAQTADPATGQCPRPGQQGLVVARRN